MEIISRGRWGAAPPRARTLTTWPKRTEFVVHYSEGPTTQTPKSIQSFHMTDPPEGRGWDDIGYNFLVGRDGEVYEGRGWLVVGAHAKDHNVSGIGVCFIGDEGDATDEAKTSIRDMYDLACQKADRTLHLRGHGQLASTTCPGAQLLAWVEAGAPRPGAPLPGRVLKLTQPPMHGEDVVRVQHAVGVEPDSRYGPETAAAVKAFQSAHGLTADGIVGRKTWAAIMHAPS
ncbi:peptidoglycan recognition protein family protein [Actinocorallia populi]|uniref:peptidoglycan recognition protein family protein n=1 Tax=Actinocorallia populi TaxID=2079200 RepID=UPI000D091E09|nr:peptidoglycan-binding domain-containing protein [Actinocorallia populi]